MICVPTPQRAILSPGTPHDTRLLLVQAGFGGFYNGNSAKLILAEVSREHGQATADQMIRECQLDQVFGFEAGTF